MTRRIRTQRINGFKVNVGRRRPRKVRDYKVRKGSYKTKVGAVWKSGKYFRKGAYRKSKKGWVKYRRKKL